MARATRGQMTNGGIVAVVVSVAVFAIVGVGVVLPIINDVIASSGVSGLTATIIGFIPVVVGVMVFMGVIRPLL